MVDARFVYGWMSCLWIGLDINQVEKVLRGPSEFCVSLSG
jgi:hypothetical protein